MVLEKARDVDQCSNIDHVRAKFYSRSHTFIEMWRHIAELGVVVAEVGDEMFACQACIHQR